MGRGRVLRKEEEGSYLVVSLEEEREAGRPEDRQSPGGVVVGPAGCSDFPPGPSASLLKGLGWGDVWPFSYLGQQAADAGSTLL